MRLSDRVTLLNSRIDIADDRQDIELEFEADPSFVAEWRPFLHAHLEAPTSFQAIPSQALVPAARTGRAWALFRPILPPGKHKLLLGFSHRDDATRRHAIGEREGLMNLGAFVFPEADRERICAGYRGTPPELVHRMASRALFPLFLNSAGRLTSWPERGTSSHKVAIISIRKSGTYLLARLIEELGFVSSGMHLSRGHIDDYRYFDLADVREAYRELDVWLSTSLVTEGQYVATHIEHEPKSQVALSDFVRIFARRNLREAIVSMFRMVQKHKDHRGYREDLDGLENRFFGNGRKRLFARWFERTWPIRHRDFETMLGWANAREAFQVSFEELIGDLGVGRQTAAFRGIAERCGVNVTPSGISDLVKTTIGSQTMTFSGARTELKSYWSVEAEAIFVNRGFAELNRRLGYD